MPGIEISNRSAELSGNYFKMFKENNFKDLTHFMIVLLFCPETKVTPASVSLFLLTDTFCNLEIRTSGTISICVNHSATEAYRYIVSDSVYEILIENVPERLTSGILGDKVKGT